MTLDQHRKRRLGARHWPVQRIALEGFAARRADQPQQFSAAQTLARSCASVVINVFFHNGPVQIVGAEALRDLRDLRRHHHPIRFDVLDVVQHQARHGDGPDVVETRRLGDVPQRRVLRVKRQWNEGLKAAGFALS